MAYKLRHKKKWAYNNSMSHEQNTQWWVTEWTVNACEFIPSLTIQERSDFYPFVCVINVWGKSLIISSNHKVCVSFCCCCYCDAQALHAVWCGKSGRRGRGEGDAAGVSVCMWWAWWLINCIFFMCFLLLQCPGLSRTYIPYGTTRTGEEKEKKGNRFDLSGFVFYVAQRGGGGGDSFAGHGRL